MSSDDDEIDPKMVMDALRDLTGPKPTDLTDEEEGMLAEVLAEFEDAVQDGKKADNFDYMDRLPNERMKRAFEIRANTSMALRAGQVVREAENRKKN